MSDDWLRSRAKAMRREPGVFERRLWTLLRDRRLEGLKFRRQVAIAPYIVDFLCLRHRLIVEADGGVHEDDLKDGARDDVLKAQGFHVLRFTNQQIENRPHEVIAAILRAVKPNAR